MLTSKVVPKDLRKALVKFENFWCTTLSVMQFLVYYPESVHPPDPRRRIGNISTILTTELGSELDAKIVASSNFDLLLRDEGFWMHRLGVMKFLVTNKTLSTACLGPFKLNSFFRTCLNPQVTLVDP